MLFFVGITYVTHLLWNLIRTLSENNLIQSKKAQTAVAQ